VLSTVLDSPNFFLPEINALWIRMLHATVSTIAALKKSSFADSEFEDLAARADVLARTARNAFARVFCVESTGYLANAVYCDGVLRDETECEAGIIALALLGRDVFSESQLQAALRRVKETLVVRRRLVELGQDEAPFGVLVKNEPAEPYYNDAQYHASVVWPRSTPYLIRLLEMIGGAEATLLIEDLLRNTLDHQMSEGALFCTHELFSLPIGNNPFPGRKTQTNPVPVKNPMQFWSQWCDPFLEPGRSLDQRQRLSQLVHGSAMKAVRTVPVTGDSACHEAQSNPDTANRASEPESRDAGRAAVPSLSTISANLALRDMDPKGPPLVFLSYCRKDADQMKQLREHLEGLVTYHVIELFVDETIEHGDDWRARIEEAIRQSRIALLLLTPGFLGSETIRDLELTPMIKRREEDPSYRIIPIVAKRCAWEVTLVEPLGIDRINVFPRGCQPIWSQEKEKVSKDLKIWNPEILLSKTVESIARSLVWMQGTQCKDGGWSYRSSGTSVFWETAFSTLCLAEARDLKIDGLTAVDIDGMLEKAATWLSRDTGGWRWDYSPVELLPTYNVALAIFCFLRLGSRRFPSEFASRIDAATRKLAASQCEDGGWASRGWSQEERHWPIAEAAGEVGATSFAVRALLRTAPSAAQIPATSDLPYRENIVRAVRWILESQNSDGSWADLLIAQDSDIPKTCDAVQMLVAVQRAGIGGDRLSLTLEKGVSWLQRQERAIFQEGAVQGWGWDVVPREVDAAAFEQDVLLAVQSAQERDIIRAVYRKNDERRAYVLCDEASDAQREVVMKILLHSGQGLDFTSTCLTIETLVETRQASLPLLSSSVEWLSDNQHRKAERPEEGMWGRNTARISLALVKFCKRLQQEVAP